ncbi:NAD-dependent epimerase/dehydratase family protein [Candidatus Oscillochloris fontis]|uniref:NAD-dependent epimerase/dehydratase family protein n=1 Tax=Candidatus Oscillochloris fontis TaxID=2496868 RepID=UPI00101DF38B|nr:NAD(P)-dependent oxidoreductase [Candidatus Oscillochloris fontis]
MTRVILTGASGFIAQHTLAPLLARGYEIHAPVRQIPAQSIPGVVWHQVDLLDPMAVTNLMVQVRPHSLLHMAWYVAHGHYWRAPENLAWVQASLHLIQQFWAAGGQRVVCAGTCAEYDWRHGYCVEQVTPTVPQLLYGTAKHALQTLLSVYATQQQLSFAWGRIFFLYGPHEPPARFVASIIQALLNGQPAPCSHGHQVRDLLYVHDVADAFVTLLASDVQGPVNIGSGQPISLGEVAEQIGQMIGRPDLIQLGARPTPLDDPPFLVASVQRLHHEVGWQPSYRLHQGVEATIAWWRSRER